MSPNETFDLGAVVAAVWGAFRAVVCTIGFQLAVHGLFVALVIAASSLISAKRDGKWAHPLFKVFKKVAITCVVLAVPGAISLMTSGKLPQVNQLELNSFGLLGFWALVVAHFCMEEMNFEFFDAKNADDAAVADAPVANADVVDTTPVGAGRN